MVENVKLGKTIGLVRARELVKEIKNYDATVTIKKGRKEAKADDYWAVVGLGLLRGTEVTLSAEGRQSRQAVDALARFGGQVGGYAPRISLFDKPEGII